MRTALTLPGIVIGVASVAAMLAIGRGAQEDFIARASAIGTSWVVVSSDQDTRMPRRPLTPEDAQALKGRHNVQGVMPGRWERAAISTGPLSIQTDVLGIDGGFHLVHGWDAVRGGIFTRQNERAGSPVLLLVATAARTLFPDDRDQTGEFVMVNMAPFMVGGVLASKGPDEQGHDRNKLAVMPLASLGSRVYGPDELSMVVVALGSMARVAQANALLRAVMTRRHGSQDFWLTDDTGAFQAAEAARAAQNLLLGHRGDFHPCRRHRSAPRRATS